MPVFLPDAGMQGLICTVRGSNGTLVVPTFSVKFIVPVIVPVTVAVPVATADAEPPRLKPQM
jgi:hypothetical protein